MEYWSYGSRGGGLTVAIDARLIGTDKTGDATHWRGLLHGLAGIPNTPRLLLLSNAPRPVGIPWNPQWEWVCLPSRNSRWWSWVAMPLEARRRGADLVHVQYNLSPLIRNGITTIHDISFLIGPEWFSPRDQVLLAKGVAGSVRRARRVVTVSETSRREIERMLPAAAGKTRVVYNACPPWVRPLPEPKAVSLRARLGIPEPYVLTVGTRWPRKNMELAVRAMDGLPSDLPHRLVVTGKAGWGDQSLGSRGVATGYVEEDELCALYQGASLYLAPSRHEGFGIPLLEAFACGCPVACSTGGALPEVAADAAEVIRGWDPSDWSQAVQGLLRDSGKLQTLRERGYRRVRDFDWAASAEVLCRIYEECHSSRS
jgi:glycosyltransferase involved in cell wall biosynthesis